MNHESQYQLEEEAGRDGVPLDNQLLSVLALQLGEYHSMKIARIQDMAMTMKAPMICINDSGGARIEEGISSLSGYSGMFLRHTKASGVVPAVMAINPAS